MEIQEMKALLEILNDAGKKSIIIGDLNSDPIRDSKWDKELTTSLSDINITFEDIKSLGTNVKHTYHLVNENKEVDQD
jgi:hypothetical protein